MGEELGADYGMHIHRNEFVEATANQRAGEKKRMFPILKFQFFDMTVFL